MESRVLFLIALCVLVTPAATQACPAGCNCPAATEVTCLGTNVCPSAIDATVETLRISNSHCGTTLERSTFSHLKSLKILELTGCDYTSIGDHAFADTKLTLLTISGSLQSFSPSSFSGLSGLTKLQLPSNQISAVPDNLFWELSALTTLNLQGNQLTRLSDYTFTGLGKLMTLDLTSNTIRQLTATCFRPLISLRALKITHNELSTLPNGFLAGVPMTTLIVDNNHLTTIEPDAFTNSSLVAFKMDHNRFTSFPTAAFQRLTRQVRVLYLSYNSIDKITAGDAARMNIAVLDLTSNPLKTVEAGGFAGSTVGTLTLKNTQLTTLPEEDSAVWTSLTKLDLGGVVDWECDCDSLWLANYLAGSAGSVGPACSAATTGKDMKSSVAEIEAMCLTTTTTTESTTTTTTTPTTTTTTTQQPTQTQPPIAHTQQPQTQAPVTQTQAPVSQTPSPQIVTPLPQTQAPVPQTQPPQTHTQQPQTQAHQTQAPLTQTPFPQTPVPPTQAPLPQTPVQQTQAPVAQAPKSEDDNTTNMGLIIGTVMGLSAAICCAVIAICAIQLSKSALAQLLQATRVSPSSNESFGRDPESQRDYGQRKSKVEPDDAPRQEDRNYDRDNFDAEDPDPGMWPYDRPSFPRPA